MFFRSTKGDMIPAAIVELGLVIISFLIMLSFFSRVGSEAQDIASEQVCRRTNELAVGLIPPLVRQTLGSPQGCKTLDQGALPSGGYHGAEGAQEQISKLVERCWWMWLEGVTSPEGKEDVLTATLGSKDKQCFSCYTFSLKKDVMFSAQELSHFLATHPYRVRDASDQCAGSRGGYCLESCEEATAAAAGGLTKLASGPSPVEVKAVESKKDVESRICSPGARCCVAERDPCVSKGGRCLLDEKGLIFFDAGSDALWFRYAQEDGGWACGTGSCYVAQRNFLSTVDYVQQFEGPGAVLMSNGITGDGTEQNPSRGFSSGKLYTVAFIEDTTAAKVLGVIGGAVGGGVGFAGGAALAIGAVGLSVISAPVVATAAAAGLVIGALWNYNVISAAAQFFEKNEIDAILIAEEAELRTNNINCAVTSGVEVA